MRRTLKLHPDSRCPAVKSLTVRLDRSGRHDLTLRYRLTSRLGDVRLPPLASPTRTDELWRRTCFEAFIGSGAGPGYCELNFAPSTQWAAYRFTDYRGGMRPLLEIGAPHIEVRVSVDSLELSAVLDLSPLADLPTDRPWRLGLSAVIEQADGSIAYWALAHPPGKPDFHHADCLACEVMAPPRP